MKRFGIVVAGVLLASVIGGCDSGIPEGSPKGGPTDPQPADFKEYMKKNGGNMTNKKPTKTKSAPAPAATPTPKTEAKDTP